VNVPRPVNLNVVNPLLQNHVSLTFIPINVSVHQLNHLAAAKLHQHAANLPANCVAGSRNAAAQILAVPRITAVLQLQRMTAAPQLQKPVVLLLPKHVPLQLLKLAVHQPLKPAVLLHQRLAVLLLLKHVPHRLLRLAVLQLPKAAAPLLRPVLLRLQIPAAMNSLAATLILAKSLN
jgi:hypothetical protein